MEKKIYTTTKAQMFATVIAIVENSDDPNRVELVERLQREIDLISNKKSTSKKAKKNAELNTSVTEIILDVLANAEKPMTVTEIRSTSPELAVTNGISSSRITANLTKLVKSGKVNRVEEKKKSYYSLV